MSSSTRSGGLRRTASSACSPLERHRQLVLAAQRLHQHVHVRLHVVDDEHAAVGQFLHPVLLCSRRQASPCTRARRRTRSLGLVVLVSVDQLAQAAEVVGGPAGRPRRTEVGERPLADDGRSRPARRAAVRARRRRPTRSNGRRRGRPRDCRRPRRSVAIERKTTAARPRRPRAEPRQVASAVAAGLLERLGRRAQAVGAEVAGGPGEACACLRRCRRSRPRDGGAQRVERLPLPVGEPQQHPLEARDGRCPSRCSVPCHIDALEARRLGRGTARAAVAPVGGATACAARPGVAGGGSQRRSVATSAAVDRLRDVVVHAGGEAGVEVGLHRVRRHRDDRQLTRSRVGTQRPRRLQAVELGHLHVHQDGGVLRRRRLRHARPPRGRSPRCRARSPAARAARSPPSGSPRCPRPAARARRRTPARCGTRSAPRRMARAALRLDDRVEQRRGGDRLGEEHVHAELGAARLLFLAGVGADHDDRQAARSRRARGCARRPRDRSCPAASSRA